MKKVIAAIPVHNRLEKTLSMLYMLLRSDTGGFVLDILVIDDGSTDGTYERITRDYKHVKAVKGDGTLWWGGAVNVALRYALQHDYDYLYIVNNDTDIEENTVSALFQTLENNADAACSSLLLKINRRSEVQSAGYQMSNCFQGLKNPYKGKVYEPAGCRYTYPDSMATQSCMIPVSVARRGFFVDEKRFPHNFSDLEYFMRLKKNGVKLIVDWRSRAYADESTSNYHRFIVQNGFGPIFRSFFNKKYAHNIHCIYNVSLLNSSFVPGILRFSYNLSKYWIWVALKLLLPLDAFKRLLVRTNRL